MDELPLFLAWPFLGVLIGAWASQRKRFSLVAGVVGGALLGGISPLMFLVSGTRRKCPACAEMIASDAKVCRFCQRQV